MAHSYEDVVAALRPVGDPALDRFAQAVRTHFEDVYDQTFALGEPGDGPTSGGGPVRPIAER